MESQVSDTLVDGHGRVVSQKVTTPRTEHG